MPRRPSSILLACVAVALLAGACGLGDRAIPRVVPLTSQQTAIFAADGTEITRLEAEENREVVPLSQIPAIMQNAVIAIEDERFWEHNGIDLRGIARAARSNAEAGGVSEGGSTITQQYVKNALLGPQRTLDRKLEEANLALQMERDYSKSYILEQYLNTIFFGNRAYGVQMAAKRYFGHPASELTLPEAALLAGIIQAPSRYDPYVNLQLASDRRDLVLERMRDLGYITADQFKEAKATAVLTQLVPPDERRAQSRYPAPHFVEEVKRFIRTDPRFGDTAAERNDLLVNGGLRIYTTLDLDMQQKMESAVRARYSDQGRSDPDVGMVAVEPRTGFVRAMYGGYDFWDTDPRHSYAQVNLAMGGGRQTGSTFKAVTLATALASGVEMSDTFSAPKEAVIRIPGYEPWKVGGVSLGRARLETCVINSANTCFANLMADPRVGPAKVAEYAARMGIDTGGSFKVVPSETLGTNNNTVLEMTAAFDTYANRGVFVAPSMVTKVVRADGTVLFQNTHLQTKILEPEQADAATRAFEGVLREGTAKGRGIGRPAGGKTGTTQDQTDAWFIGFTPDLVTGVWVGYSQPTSSRRGAIGRLRPLPGYGASMAAPVWQSFMTAALADVPPTPFGTGGLLDEASAAPVVTTTTVPPGNTDIYENASDRVDMVTMPDLVGGTTTTAASRVRRADLKLERVDISGTGKPPGQVLSQSPAPGSAVPVGSTVVIEATPGNPPPSIGLPATLGQLASDVAPRLRRTGWTVTQVSQAAPPGFRLPDGREVTGGMVWQMTPGAGTVVRDGRVTIVVQPGSPPPPTTTTVVPPSAPPAPPAPAGP